MGKEFGVRKPGLAQELDMPTYLEATRLVVPGGAVRFDEVAVDEHTALRKCLVTAGINIRHGLLAAEIV
jgi:hypothetical protein